MHIQINDLTEKENSYLNLTIDRVIEMAKTNIVVMTLRQWQELTQQHDNPETYLAVNALLIQTTYLGFFQAMDEKETYCIGIFTGMKIPFGITTQWTQIMDLRIAIPHASTLPWIVFSTSHPLDTSTQTFVKTLFSTITQTCSNKSRAIYDLVTNHTVKTSLSKHRNWYWMYGSVLDEMPTEVNPENLIPLRGDQNDVLLIDPTHQTHHYTFDPLVGALRKARTGI
ncbi:hypothetical protein GF369_04800 [Candidatus Peregrinibacteria bacterium]|nr:hypothetical protein [Candidatus Peregrinibacteria bacterium]